MTHARAARGRAGEEAAARHLEGAGYRILATGWRASGREIDIVAEKNGVIAFVEVKTRAADALAPPAMAVDWRKRRQVIAAAHAAAARWDHPGAAFRFDVVCVTWAAAGLRVEHIEDAFRA